MTKILDSLRTGGLDSQRTSGTDPLTSNSQHSVQEPSNRGSIRARASFPKFPHKIMASIGRFFAMLENKAGDQAQVTDQRAGEAPRPQHVLQRSC